MLNSQITRKFAARIQNNTRLGRAEIRLAVNEARAEMHNRRSQIATWANRVADFYEQRAAEVHSGTDYRNVNHFLAKANDYRTIADLAWTASDHNLNLWAERLTMQMAAGVEHISHQAAALAL